MKKKLFTLLTLLLCLCSTAWADDVTINRFALNGTTIYPINTTDKMLYDEVVFSTEETPTLDNNVLKVSANKYVTISANGNTISKIVIVWNNANNSTTADSGELAWANSNKTMTWTGSATSVKFTSGVSTRINSAVITYTDDNPLSSISSTTLTGFSRVYSSSGAAMYSSKSPAAPGVNINGGLGSPDSDGKVQLTKGSSDALFTNGLHIKSPRAISSVVYTWDTAPTATSLSSGTYNAETSTWTAPNTETKEVTLYNRGTAAAKFTQIVVNFAASAATHTITLDDNGEYQGNGTATATEESATLTNITAPKRDGYVVEGYYDDAIYSNKVATAAGTLQPSTAYTDANSKWTSTSDEVSLYAKWEAATFTVTIAKNYNDYGTVTSESVANVPYNTTISASGNVLTVGSTGITATEAEATAEYTYAFSNWTGIPDGGTVTDNITVTANFTRTPVNYTLSWSSNGGDALTGSYTSGTVEFGSSIIAPNTPTYEGHVFLGWAESADGAVVSVPATMPAANKTYYAQWIEGTATTITYDLKTNSTSTTLDNCTSATPNSGSIIASTVINTYGTANCDGSDSAKEGETQKLKIDAEYTAANYYEWTFTENNCTFAPTNVQIKFQSVSDLVQYTVALTDGITTKTTNFVQTTAKGGTLETLDWNITDGTVFAANKTIKLQLWAYKKNSGATAFRLGSPIEIMGAVNAVVPISVGAKGYATYCNSDYALDFTGKSIKAFIAANPNGNEVTFTQVDKIAKGEPVLLYSETNSDSQLIPAIAESEVTKKTDTENYFRKGDGTTAYEWADADESRIYVLNTTTKSPGFYKANKNKVATTKAYLSMPAGVNARFGGLFFDGETTGINAIDNGQLTIDNDAPMYNLAGQRVNKSYKGVVVQNGKKMLNK